MVTARMRSESDGRVPAPCAPILTRPPSSWSDEAGHRGARAARSPTSATAPAEERAHERRADKAAYLHEKLDEQAEALGRVSVAADDLERCAELVVRFGANVQPRPDRRDRHRAGQGGAHARASPPRPTARARSSSTSRTSTCTSSARGILHADEDTLDYVPPWYGERLLALGEQRAARIGLTGPVDARPARRPRPRARRPRPAAVPARGGEGRQRPHDELDGGAVPDAGVGASSCYPDLEPDAALDRLWEQILHVCRLDEDDPVAAWRERAGRARRRRRAADRAALRRAALRRARAPTCASACCRARAGWRRASQTVDGHRAHAEPPDRGGLHDARPAARRRRRSRSTKPLVVGGTIVRGLRVRFEGGRAVADRRRRGRRAAARATPSATRARRGSARSRSSTARAASARSTRSSTTRCSTRTRRRTSRSARPTSSRSARRTVARDQRARDPRRLHDRRARRRRHRRRPPTATAVPVLRGGAWQI